MYASLGLDGEVEVTVRLFNRAGNRVPLRKGRGVEFEEIEFRALFLREVGKWG